MSSKQMFKRLLKAIGFTLFCVFLVLAGYLLHVWFLGNCTIISHDFERERPVPPITNVSFVGSFVAIGDGESIAGAGVFIRYVRTNVYASDPPIHHVIVSAENVFRKLDPSGGNAPVTLSLHFPDTKKNRWIPIAVTGTVYYSKDSDSKYANPFALIEIPETSLPNEKDLYFLLCFLIQLLLFYHN